MTENIVAIETKKKSFSKRSIMILFLFLSLQRDNGRDSVWCQQCCLPSQIDLRYYGLADKMPLVLHEWVCLSVAERDGGYVQPPVNVSDCEGTQVVLSHSLPVVVVVCCFLFNPSNAIGSLFACSLHEFRSRRWWETLRAKENEINKKAKEISMRLLVGTDPYGNKQPKGSEG